MDGRTDGGDRRGRDEVMDEGGFGDGHSMWRDGECDHAHLSSSHLVVPDPSPSVTSDLCRRLTNCGISAVTA